MYDHDCLTQDEKNMILDNNKNSVSYGTNDTTRFPNHFKVNEYGESPKNYTFSPNPFVVYDKYGYEVANVNEIINVKSHQSLFEGDVSPPVFLVYDKYGIPIAGFSNEPSDSEINVIYNDMEDLLESFFEADSLLLSADNNYNIENCDNEKKSNVKKR